MHVLLAASYPQVSLASAVQVVRPVGYSESMESIFNAGTTSQAQWAAACSVSTIAVNPLW